ncbi:MAG: RnfH family protein [Gammaproteobacteria bacterium]|nr:RnfH family protein [Gammaproteobacteria bacterium]
MTDSGKPAPPLAHQIRCEVVFATPAKQVLLALQVDAGTTAGEAVKLSGISAEFPDADFSAPALGIFSRPVKAEYVLEDGNRVEIYRPLEADPKEVRRALAALGQTIGERDGVIEQE